QQQRWPRGGRPHAYPARRLWPAGRLADGAGSVGGPAVLAHAARQVGLGVGGPARLLVLVLDPVQVVLGRVRADAEAAGRGLEGEAGGVLDQHLAFLRGERGPGRGVVVGPGEGEFGAVGGAARGEVGVGGAQGGEVVAVGEVADRSGGQGGVVPAAVGDRTDDRDVGSGGGQAADVVGRAGAVAQEQVQQDDVQ